MRSGAEPLMATMIGSELSTMDFGHFNAFPLVLRDEVRGGPFDWAGGDGPTLRVNELFEGVRAEHPGLPGADQPSRAGSTGVLTLLRVDTDTLATHADPLRGSDGACSGGDARRIPGCSATTSTRSRS